MKEDEAVLDVSTESLVRDMLRDKMKIPEEDVRATEKRRLQTVQTVCKMKIRLA